MREKIVRLYQFSELSEEAQQNAIEHYRNTYSNECHWQYEIFDSLKHLIEALPGIKLIDYRLGAYSYSYIQLSFSQNEVADLSHGRAMAWLENNLLWKLRIPWTGKKRTDVRKYGSAYRPDKIKPCPFTGVYFDEDYLDALIENVRQGMSLKDSLLNLADVYSRLLEAAFEDQNSDEYISDTLEANEYEFTEDGDRQ